MDEMTPSTDPLEPEVQALPEPSGEAVAGVPFLPPAAPRSDSPLGAPAGAFAPGEPVEIALEAPPAPRKRRKGVLVGAAVLLVAVVVGVVLAVGGTSDAGYSLKAATASAGEATNVAFDMHMTMAGQDIDMTARLDMEHQLMAAEAKIPILDDGLSFEMILDLGNLTMYLDTSGIPGAGDAPTKWVSMDMSKVPGLEDQMGSITDSNPLDVAKLFDGSSEVVDKGLEDVAGEKVRHYVVTVDFAALMKAQPNTFEQLQELGAEMPDTVDYDVWVTKDSELRKMGFSMPMMGQTVTMEMTVRAIGDIEPIVLPSPDEVTDMTSLIGS